LKDKLRITEIFYSLQGETKTIGLPTAFVRLTGCPLRCQYCDSAYAFQGGQLYSIDEVLQQLEGYQARYVTVTGGEPLTQPLCFELLERLCDLGYEVSLETSGALDVSRVDRRVTKILDLKTPGSREVDRNLYENINYLFSHDQVKFVICDRSDYEWAKDLIMARELVQKCDVLFSPSHEQLENKLLADWIIEDNLPVRFQLQLHKYVWGDIPGV
jgi:7-carboxy-7-deazaguanine synthase